MVHKKGNIWIKRVIQIGFFIFIFSIVFSNFLERRGINSPFYIHNFHAICPFGAVETAGRLILDGKFIPKIHESNLWVFFGVVLSTLIIGAAFCGYLCPLGSVQEWIGSIGKKIFKKRFNRFIGEKMDHLLGYMRYGVLLITILVTTRMVTLVFQRFDPYYALFHFWTGDVFPVALVVLGTVLVLSLFFERPWCRWFCPFGAMLGIIQLFSPCKPRRNEKLCASCMLCTRACPMRIHIHKNKSVLDTRCNRCWTCISSCPREGALTYSIGRKPLIISKKNPIPVILLLTLFAAPIIFAQERGLFKTSNKPVIAHGKITPEEIKGSMTLKELAKSFNIDINTINKVLGIPPDIPDSTRIFDLEDIDELMTVKNVKLKLSKYQPQDDG